MTSMKRMRRCIPILAIILALCVPCGIYAEDALVVMSLRTTGFNEVMDSAMSTCSTGTFKIIVLSENTNVNLPQLVRSTRPKSIIVFGDSAQKFVSSSVRAPVLGVMVSHDTPGISYVAPPEAYLSIFAKMGKRQVGVVNSSQFSGYIKTAADMARNYGVTLVRREASSPTEGSEMYTSIIGQVDALWILPDSKIVTAASAEVLLKKGQEKNLPVVAFSQDYLKNGAAVIVEANRKAIGAAIGEAVCDNDGKIMNYKSLYKISKNKHVLERLKLNINTER